MIEYIKYGIGIIAIIFSVLQCFGFPYGETIFAISFFSFIILHFVTTYKIIRREPTRKKGIFLTQMYERKKRDQREVL